MSNVKSSTSVEKGNIAVFIRVVLALENTMLLEYNGVRNIFLNKIYDIWIIRILIPTLEFVLMSFLLSCLRIHSRSSTYVANVCTHARESHSEEKKAEAGLLVVCVGGLCF